MWEARSHQKAVRRSNTYNSHFAAVTMGRACYKDENSKQTVENKNKS